jgi:hypothetical protein
LMIDVWSKTSWETPARTRGETTIAGTRGSKNFREIWPRSAVFVTICASCLLPLNK